MLVSLWNFLNELQWIGSILYGISLKIAFMATRNSVTLIIDPCGSPFSIAVCSYDRRGRC